MFANHAVYKGYRLSAHVHRELAPEGTPGSAPGTFYATLAIVAIAGETFEPLPPLASHSADNPREAMEAAVAYGRVYIDGLSSFTKGRKAVSARTKAPRSREGRQIAPGK